jgi:AcrR family transcriptional regulator
LKAQEQEKLRDAERSRKAIRDSAERLFAERGYDGASLGDIGAAAGLSRGSPSYFFGSKADLYTEVLRAAFAARQQATEQAFLPVRDWCDGGDDTEALRAALMRATQGYIRFLLSHPSFVSLVMREELEAASRIGAVSESSTAITDAFRAVRRVGARRGICSFRVEEAVLLFVCLTFGAVSYRRTLLPAQGVDVQSEQGMRRQAKLVVEQMMFCVTS